MENGLLHNRCPPPILGKILRKKSKCCKKQCVQFACVYGMYMFLCICVGVHFQSSYHLKSEKLIIVLWFSCPINIRRLSSYLLEGLQNHHFLHVNPVLENLLVVLLEGQLVENSDKLLLIPFSFSWFSIFSLIMFGVSSWLTSLRVQCIGIGVKNLLNVIESYKGISLKNK